MNDIKKPWQQVINNVTTDGITPKKIPMYIYIEFIKMYRKTFSIYIIAGIILILGLSFGPTCFNVLGPKLNQNFITSDENHLQKSESTYIQSFNPVIYDKMLKELREMQQAAMYLQIKQQATERRTLALQQEVHELKSSTNDKAGILNEEQAQQMIKDALSVYDADKLGLRDYALESTGAYITSTPFTTPYLTKTQYVIFGYFTYPIYSNPRTMIQPDIHPGNCFAFEGEQGRIRLKLSNMIFISAITVEHAARILLTPEEIRSAPKNFQIIGLENKNSETGTPLGTFMYAIEGPARQTFLITNPKDTLPYQFIEIYLLNNYGNIDVTCVYRIRIHGQPF